MRLSSLHAVAYVTLAFTACRYRYELVDQLQAGTSGPDMDGGGAGGEAIVGGDVTGGQSTTGGQVNALGGSASAGETGSPAAGEAGAAGAASPAIDCSGLSASGAWLSVAGDADYGTSAFCVMKFEAKGVAGSPRSDAEGLPWVDVSRDDAASACASLGLGAHLITNSEWMTIGALIASLPSNWSGNSVGAGNLFRGHTDLSPNARCAAASDDALGFVEGDCTPRPTGGGEDDEPTQRRTHELGPGQLLWDLSGNAMEWSATTVLNDKPGGAAQFYEYTALTGTASLPLSQLIPTAAVKVYWNDSWNSTQGVGRYFSGLNGTGGAMIRGGPWWDGSTAGIFYTTLEYAPERTGDFLSFRCTAPQR